MILRKIVFSLCILVIFSLIAVVLTSPYFADWDDKEAGEYYLENSASQTGSANSVASIVWDYRGFDTLGEETVLFTAAVGVLTIIIFGFKIRRIMG